MAARFVDPMLKKLCLISENISEPIDEGIKKAIVIICAELKRMRDCMVIGRNISGKLGENIKGNRLYLNFSFINKIRGFSPDVIIYFPESSLTLASFIRGYVMSFFQKPVVIVGLQPREFSTKSMTFIRFLKPDLLFVQSSDSERFFASKGFNVTMIRSGVDLDRFVPVKTEVKRRLREKYGVPQDKKILLHVGHLTKKRNLEDLILLGDDDTQPLVVASTSTEMDIDLRQKLEGSGIIVYREYVEAIEHLYQMADMYVFPTRSRTAAIELPLSVLEAMACGLPVLTRPFGGLKDALEKSDSVAFYDSIDEARRKLTTFTRAERQDPYRDDQIMKFSWDSVVHSFLEEVERRCTIGR